ncbi:MAG: sterol desaturase family protein [Oligoflexia bacterium]|nr:sterol desaturase family protein [Oligoflexia bacterium]
MESLVLEAYKVGFAIYQSVFTNYLFNLLTIFLYFLFFISEIIFVKIEKEYFLSITLDLMSTILNRAFTPIFDVLLFFPIYIFVSQQNLTFFRLNFSIIFPGNLGFFLDVFYGVVLIDFFLYIYHYFSHKFNLLFRLHEMHHQNSALTFLSGGKSHPVASVLSKAFTNLGLAIMFTNGVAIFYSYMFFRAYSAFVHSNIPISFRYFDRFLTSPLYHRIHHFADEDYYGKNLSTFFSFYDLLLGLQVLPSETINSKKPKLGLSCDGYSSPRLRSFKQTMTFFVSLLLLRETVSKTNRVEHLLKT